MALLKFKRSATPSKVPTTSDLSLGELAMNTFDGKLYMKKDDGTEAIVEIGGGATGGTVTSVAASGGTGISVTGSPITTSGTLTITNTAPDQTVTLTQGGTTTITGTYPNFTISSADQYSGTVTSVGGTGSVNGLTLSGTVTSSGSLTLGGTLAISNADWSGTDLSVANGGTGASTAAGALANLGAQAAATALTTSTTFGGDVSGTYNAIVVVDDSHNHIISNVDGLQTALDAKAPLASPALTGTPTAPTAAVSTNTTQLATTAFVNAEIANDAPTKTGGGASGTWGISITGNAATVTNGLTTSTTFGGDVSGTYNAIVVADDSHNHIYDNIDGLTTNAWGGPRITTASGYIDFGPANTSWAHIYTDRPAFYFNVDTSADDVYGRSSVRAPIFYDNNNTAYYTNPESSTRLNGWLSFGVAGGGANTSGRWISIEGNAATDGEGSGRVFFTEHNSTTAAMDNYGMSLAYRGGSTSIVGASGNTWTGLTQIGNGEWGMFGHDNNATGALIMSGFRDGAYVKIHGANGLYVGEIRRLNGVAAIDLDSATYTQFRDPTGSVKQWIGNNDTSYYNNNVHYFRNSASGVTMSIDTSGNVIATGSHRAPIFYDSNDTGYYVDPASTSASLVAAGPLRSGPATALPLSYASNFSANGASIQITLERTGTSVGWGGIGADINNCFAAWNSSAVSQFRVTTSGAAFAVDSFRAPIFYDSNDTAYYVNPNATSNCSTIQSIEFQNSAGDGRGHRFWASDSYKIWMSSAGNGTWGGRVAGETTSDYNMYFRMTGGTNRGFVFMAGASGTTAVAGIDASGNGRFIGDVVAYSSSDARLKENLEVIPNALDKVSSLTGYTFDWNDKQTAYEAGKRDVGIVAQDVEAVLPEVVVDREETGYKAVNYEKLVPLLIEAIKELKAEVETLKKG